jgi:DUF1009 family protein
MRAPSRDAGPLAIICGGGSIPLALARAVTARGRRVLMLPIRGFADPAVESFPHRWFHLGTFRRPFRAMREVGCREAVMIGSLVRPRFSVLHLRIDATTLRLLPRLAAAFRGGDDRLLSGIAAILEGEGFVLRGAHEVAPELLMPAGIVGRRAPGAEEREDIRFGMRALRALGPFDVGQAVIVAGQRVLAVEAAEGTAAMLARMTEMRRTGRVRLAPHAGVLVKAPKPGQDRRIDLPAIGPETVVQAREAGLVGIAAEAGSVMVAEPDALVRAAEEAGLFVIGVDSAEADA